MWRGQFGMYTDEECRMDVVKLQKVEDLSEISKLQAVHIRQVQLQCHLPEGRHIVEGILGRVVGISKTNAHHRPALEYFQYREVE